jgi:hypothetical protein
METFIPCHEYVMWCEAGSKMPASGILFNVAVVNHMSHENMRDSMIFIQKSEK